MLNVTMKSVVAPKIEPNKFVIGPNSALARCTKPDPCHSPATARPLPGHSPATARPQPGHCPATARPNPGPPAQNQA